ncbi:hypothetical protein BKA80DRAFT_263662 [Phyllosticta citrichinensis]
MTQTAPSIKCHSLLLSVLESKFISAASSNMSKRLLRPARPTRHSSRTHPRAIQSPTIKNFG